MGIRISIYEFGGMQNLIHDNFVSMSLRVYDSSKGLKILKICIYFFTWLHWVLIAACRIFSCRTWHLFSCSIWTLSCDMQILSCRMWDLVPWAGNKVPRDQVRMRAPCIGSVESWHWTSREVPIKGAWVLEYGCTCMIWLFVSSS